MIITRYSERICNPMRYTGIWPKKYIIPSDIKSICEFLEIIYLFFIKNKTVRLFSIPFGIHLFSSSYAT